MKTIFAGCLTITVIIPIAVIGALALFVPALLERLAWYAAIGFGTITVLVLGAVASWMQNRHERRERTYIDGALPLMKRRRHIWRSDIPRPLAVWSFLNGEEFHIDPNRMVSAAWSFDALGRVSEVEPAAGWAAQREYNAQVEGTNVARAFAQGDDSRNHLFGRDSMPVRIPARALMPRVERHQLTGPVENDEIEGTFAPVAVPFGDAVRSNTATAFALGQSPNGIVRWDVERSPHIRVHGQTQGSGKTNVIKTIALGAVRQGIHVIVLDRRGFKDWSDYRSHVEFVDNRKSGAFSGTMRQICDLYRERDEQLGIHGASNLAELPNAPARLFVVVSEFGTVCRDATITGEMEETLPLLKSIMSEAGATGVHLIFEDQVVNRNWPRELRGNADPVTGYLPEDTAKAGGYGRAWGLDAYEFHFDGQRFRSWDMRVEAPRLLASIAPDVEIVIDVRSLVRSVDNIVSPPKTPEIIFVPNERTPNEPSATDLQRMVWAWRDASPAGTQADLRREFTERGIEIARSWAHDCWHKWPGASLAEQLMAQGISLADVRVRGNERIGIDISHDGAER